MSDHNPYDQLGVTENSSFDEIQEARARLMQEFTGDSKQQELVETAYDAILMDRLRMRQEGRIKVPDRIRFPEKQATPPPSPSQPPKNQSSAWIQQLLDRPDRQSVLWSTGTFTALVTLNLLLPSTGTLQLTIALGILASLVLLNRKEQKFGRSLLLMLVGLIAGTALGGLLSGILAVTLFNLGLAKEIFATLVTLLVLWGVTTFLK